MKAISLPSLLLILTCATASAAPNSGAPSTSRIYRQLNPYSHERILNNTSGFSIEGVSISKADLTVSETTDLNCGSAEYGYQGCTQNVYTSEAAVEVRIVLNSTNTSSEEPSISQWKAYFHMSDFTQDEIKAIQQNSHTFDPFGNATVRSRELARSLFGLSLSKTTLRWNEPIFGNVCFSSNSAGEHTNVQCNIIGQRVRSRLADTLRICRK